jgi:hypothetical protein
MTLDGSWYGSKHIKLVFKKLNFSCRQFYYKSLTIGFGLINFGNWITKYLINIMSDIKKVENLTKL